MSSSPSDIYDAGHPIPGTDLWARGQYVVLTQGALQEFSNPDDAVAVCTAGSQLFAKGRTKYLNLINPHANTQL